MEPSREDLLELLVRGEGLVGGARRRRGTRKGAVPPGLKKFQAFHKKHPNLTKKQASRAYQKKKKGRGLEGEEFEEEEFEGFGMLGGRKKYPKASSSAWKTKSVRENKKLIELGEAIVAKTKSLFPKEYGLVKKQATGSGVDFDDYMSFVVNQRKADATVVGVALRKAWDAAVKAGTAAYYSPYEQLMLAIGTAAKDAILAGSDVEKKNRMYLIETGEPRDPLFA